MKIVLAGGSGQVGKVLARAFRANGHQVVILSRGAHSAGTQHVFWDGRTLGPWVSELEGADVVINLAGRSVNCRYGRRNREEIMHSRVESARVIGQAISQMQAPPRCWLQAATATIYAHREDAPNDEYAGIIGGAEPGAPATWRFSIEVARAWERAASEFSLPQTRNVILRSAMIMSPDRGGIFATLLGLVRCGLGGRARRGRQFVSWIHEHDFINAVMHLIGNKELFGAVNLASPNPLPQAEFMRILRETWGAPFGLPAARWMLELGAFFMRTETELILKSRFVVPSRLLRDGFVFQFPDWESAARELCARVRSGPDELPKNQTAARVSTSGGRNIMTR